MGFFFPPAGFPLSYCSGLVLIWAEMEICFFALHHVPSTSVTSGISKLEDWVFVCAWPCVNLIRLEVFPSHRDAPGRSNRHDSRCILNAVIIIYSSHICICIHVHKHIHTSTGGYCAISQNIISALDIWMCERSLSPSMGVYPHPQWGVYRSSGRD